MHDYILEDVDLLDAVTVELLLQEEVVNEASLYGMKINKENLEDENFVKELVKKIKEDEHAFSKNTGLILLIAGVISSLTIIGLPIGLLLIAIASAIKSPYDLQQKDLKKLDECFEKTIDKLNKQLAKTKDETKKKQLKDMINKLEDNRERIYERKAKVEIQDRLKKLIKLSNYGKSGIIVKDTEIICTIPEIIDDPVSFANDFNKGKYNFKSSSKVPFEYIEQFYANGIKSHSDLLKLVDGKQSNGNLLMGGDKDANSDTYGPKVKKYLKDKQVAVILSDVHDTTIIYSFDDDCCYDWIAEEHDEITKISVQDFLNASKTCYEDLIKIAKEFK